MPWKRVDKQITNDLQVLKYCPRVALGHLNINIGLMSEFDAELNRNLGNELEALYDAITLGGNSLQPRPLNHLHQFSWNWSWVKLKNAELQQPNPIAHTHTEGYTTHLHTCRTDRNDSLPSKRWQHRRLIRDGRVILAWPRDIFISQASTWEDWRYCPSIKRKPTCLLSNHAPTHTIDTTHILSEV